MNYKKLSFAAVISIGILLINGVSNAAPLSPHSGIQSSNSSNLICDMGPTGYAAPIHKKPVKKHVPKKITYKPKPAITGAAFPIPCPAPCEPCVQPCVPVNPCPAPCQPINPCPTGLAAPVVQQIAPCPVPCQPINPCPAPCTPCN